MGKTIADHKPGAKLYKVMSSSVRLDFIIIWEKSTCSVRPSGSHSDNLAPAFEQNY